MKLRKSSLKRKTKETNINIEFNLDGSGTSKINTGIAFFDHMLQLFTMHGLFDLTLQVQGDLEVDYHHTVEDVGICLGQAFRKAIDDGQGINRFSSGLLPMDESLCQIAIDISGRSFFDWNREYLQTKPAPFNSELVEEFLKAFTDNAKITLHIEVLKGNNLHHMLEACFKALGRYLDMATAIDNRKANQIPSTKGSLLKDF